MKKLIVIPIVVSVLSILIWAKTNAGSFSLIWRYFTFFNQLIAIPVLLCGAIYLARLKRNYFVTLIPALFYVFITMAFIFSEKIGFHLPLKYAEIIAIVITFATYIYVWKLMKNSKD